MTYILQKYKSTILLILLLTLVFTILYTFTNKNINAVPEKAELVLSHINILGNTNNEY